MLHEGVLSPACRAGEGCVPSPRDLAGSRRRYIHTIRYDTTRTCPRVPRARPPTSLLLIARYFSAPARSLPFWKGVPLEVTNCHRWRTGGLSREYDPLMARVVMRVQPRASSPRGLCPTARSRRSWWSRNCTSRPRCSPPARPSCSSPDGSTLPPPRTIPGPAHAAASADRTLILGVQAPTVLPHGDPARRRGPTATQVGPPSSRNRRNRRRNCRNPGETSQHGGRRLATRRRRRRCACRSLR